MDQQCCACECPPVPQEVTQGVSFDVVTIDTAEPLFSPSLSLVLILATIALALRGTWKRRRSVLRPEEPEESLPRTWKLQLSPAERPCLAKAQASLRNLYPRRATEPALTRVTAARSQEIGLGPFLHSVRPARSSCTTR
jgi:hypothetical protein